MSIEQLFALLVFFSYLVFQWLTRVKKDEPSVEAPAAPRQAAPRRAAEEERMTPDPWAEAMLPTPPSTPVPAKPIVRLAPPPRPRLEPAVPIHAARPPRALRRTLQDREGLRHAVLLKAVLDPPLSLRPPK